MTSDDPRWAAQLTTRSSNRLGQNANSSVYRTYSRTWTHRLLPSGGHYHGRPRNISRSKASSSFSTSVHSIFVVIF